MSHDRELLRGLTTRVWVLHDRRITAFDGGFAEWELVSAERARAAALAAAEEERVRRVDEQKKTHRRDDAARSVRAAVRTAHQRVSEIEAKIQTLEAKIAGITRELEEPELYTRPNGAERAGALGRELESLTRELDRSLTAWAEATDRANALASRGS